MVIIAALERRGVASQTDHWETCVAVFLRAMPKMFGWFKPSQPKKPPDLRARDVADIISRYGELLEKYPTAYMDESWLPAPKEQMRLVFKAAWKMAPTAEMRNHVEVGWTLLSMFQPGVGAVPVDAATPKDASSNDVATTLGKYMKIADAAKPESERDYREMREFTRDPPQRRQLSS